MNIIESIYTTAPAERVSKRYNLFRTSDIVDMAASYGWQPVIQTEARVNKKIYQGKQDHMVILEHEDMKTEEGNLQMVIRNNHKGTRSLQVFVGYMRQVCSNQLFAKNLGDGMDMRIYHTTSYEQVQEDFQVFVQKIPEFFGVISKMQTKILSKKQIDKLAKRAIEIRYGSSSSLHILKGIDVSSVTRVLREEDSGNSAWVVMNRIQESLVKGTFTYDTTNKKGNTIVRKGRPIKGLNKSIDFNTKLMQEVFSMV